MQRAFTSEEMDDTIGAIKRVYFVRSESTSECTTNLHFTLACAMWRPLWQESEGWLVGSGGNTEVVGLKQALPSSMKHIQTRTHKQPSRHLEHHQPPSLALHQSSYDLFTDHRKSNAVYNTHPTS